MLAMGREMGFEAVDIDHYGGHIDFAAVKTALWESSVTWTWCRRRLLGL